MDEPNPLQQKVRDLVALQLGSQILRMCELQAELTAAQELLETLTAKPTRKKAGTSA